MYKAMHKITHEAPPLESWIKLLLESCMKILLKNTTIIKARRVRALDSSRR
jgi:hypothetical protein